MVSLLFFGDRLAENLGALDLALLPVYRAVTATVAVGLLFLLAGTAVRTWRLRRARRELRQTLDIRLRQIQADVYRGSARPMARRAA